MKVLTLPSESVKESRVVLGDDNTCVKLQKEADLLQRSRWHSEQCSQLLRLSSRGRGESSPTLVATEGDAVMAFYYLIVV
jgi:hypothetical protein